VRRAGAPCCPAKRNKRSRLAIWPPDSADVPTLTASLHGIFAQLADYIALVVRNNPYGSADALLARPDVEAMVAQALEDARELVTARLESEWNSADASQTAYYQHLLDDIEARYASPAHLRGLIRHAHASVPQAHFIVGVTPPGTVPSMEAAIQRAAAVRRAIMGFSRDVSHRHDLTFQVARTAAQTAAVLEEGAVREAAGEQLKKRWVAKKDGKTCMWCRFLDGTTVPLSAQFPLPGRVAVQHAVPDRRVATEAGEARYHQRIGTKIIWTHPPKPWHGMLPGPPLHPRCRCRIVLVPVQQEGGQATPGQRSPAPQVAGEHLAASDIRAMPEPRYRSLMAFLRAAVHELGMVLKRLAGL
jgi:hypothetical protein